MDTFSQVESTVYGLTFNDVVVLTSEILGGSQNAITAANADQAVALEYAFDLAYATNTSYEPIIQDVNKLKVIALLIDANTGEVVNANKAKVASVSDGISEFIRRPDTSASYFDLQGRSLQSPQRGLNIIKLSNGAARKVIKK